MQSVISPQHRPSRGCSTPRLCTGALWACEHLAPQNLLHDPQVVCFAIHDAFQVLNILPQLLNLLGVEFLGICNGFLHIEASPHVHEDVCRRRKLARDVERGCEGYEEWFAWLMSHHVST